MVRTGGARTSTSQSCAASKSTARSMIARSLANASDSESTSTPTICAQWPRSASASDPPIKPKPTIVTVLSLSRVSIVIDDCGFLIVDCRSSIRNLQSAIRNPQSTFSPHGFGYPAHFGDELSESFGSQALHTVGQRGLRVRVHLDEQAIGSGGDTGPRDGSHVLPFAGCVRRIEDDRQVTQLLDDRDRVDVGGIARVLLERAKAALAQHQAAIAAGQANN